MIWHLSRAAFQVTWNGFVSFLKKVRRFNNGCLIQHIPIVRIAIRCLQGWCVDSRRMIWSMRCSHCRWCGRVVCKDCSSHRISWSLIGENKRVCDKCNLLYQSLSSIICNDNELSESFVCLDLYYLCIFRNG